MRTTALIAFLFIILSPFAQNGSLETAFGVGGKVVVDVDDLDELVVLLKDNDGNTFFCGQSSEALSGEYPFDFVIGKLDSDGNLDPSFGTDGVLRGDFPGHDISSISDAVWDTSGIYFIGRGKNQDILDTNGFFVSKVTLSGEIDTNFANDGFYTSSFMGSYNTVGGIMIDNNGKVVFCGSTTHDEGTLLEYPLIGRLHQNGIPDSTFGTTGIVVWNYFDGILVDLFNLPVIYLKHGEGGYLTDIVQLGNDYLVSGHFQNSAITQMHVMKISPSGEFSEEFFTPGPHVFSIKPGATHYVSDMEVIDDIVYLSYSTPGSIYEGDFHIQTLDTNGVLSSGQTISLDAYQTTVKAMEVYNGNPYVGGYALKDENEAPGYHSDDFLMYSLTQELEPITPFGNSGVFMENFDTDDELGLEDLIHNQSHFVLGGYMNNLTGSNYTDLAFMAVQVEETNTTNELSSNSLSIYPNPVQSDLHIEIDGQLEEVRVYDLLGNIVSIPAISEGQKTIHLNSLPAGNYTLIITTEKGIVSDRILKL